MLPRPTAAILPMPLLGRLAAAGRGSPCAPALRSLLLAALLLGALAACSESPASPPASPPWFEDITAEAGLAAGDSGAGSWFPAVTGGGCAFLDHDGDGDQDLVLVTAEPRKRTQPDERAEPSGVSLYRNDGTGAFEDVTQATGIPGGLHVLGVAVGDYDGDARMDLLLTGVGGNRMLRNIGGRFEDVTESTGLAGHDTDFNNTAGFFDADGDGDLDLFICNYVRWSARFDERLEGQLVPVGRTTAPPSVWKPRHPYLYINRGDGTFEDASQRAGFRVVDDEGRPTARAVGVAFADLEGDGDTDVFVRNDAGHDFLFRNQGNGTFEEIGASMPTVRSDECALQEGCFHFDFDLDGDDDVLRPAGILDCEGRRIDPPATYFNAAQLLRNVEGTSGRRLEPVPASQAGELYRQVVARGAAYADIDGDGDLDLLLAQAGQGPLLLRNTFEGDNHWLRIRLESEGMNRAAIGASVELDAGGRTQRRFVTPTRSYGAHVELPVTFGLGRLDQVDAVRVRWPDGARTEHAVEAVDRTLVIRRGS